MQFLKIKKLFDKKKISTLFFSLLLFFVFASPTVLLAEYQPLQELPIDGHNEAYQQASEGNFTPYLNGLVKILIGVAASLAVIFITIGGVQYITTDSLTGKESGKETINNALLGLLLALASWLILNTINPDLIGEGGFIIDAASPSPDPELTDGGSDTEIE
jgi:hypothetical protein